MKIPLKEDALAPTDRCVKTVAPSHTYARVVPRCPQIFPHPDVLRCPSPDVHKIPPCCPPDAPKYPHMSQRHPKMSPEALNVSPKCPEDVQMMSPDAPLLSLKCSHVVPRCPCCPQKDPQDPPRFLRCPPCAPKSSSDSPDVPKMPPCRPQI